MINKKKIADMNFYGDGPLYPEERPFYYDPELEDTGKGCRQDEENFTMVKDLILLILSPVIGAGLILAAVFVGISIIFKR